jgi:hypothetical protein
MAYRILIHPPLTTRCADSNEMFDRSCNRPAGGEPLDARAIDWATAGTREKRSTEKGSALAQRRSGQAISIGDHGAPC